MPSADIAQRAEQLRMALHADGVCFWRTEAEGLAIPVGCSPSGWVDTGFVAPEACGTVRWHEGAAAQDGLPFILRATLTPPPAVTLTATTAASQSPAGGFFALWQRTDQVPADAQTMAEQACLAFAELLAHRRHMPLALDAQLQMRTLMGALPQGVVIVPDRSRVGFVNATAAAWLGTDTDEVELGDLSAALARLATRAQNAQELKGQVRAFLQGRTRPTLQGTIWRFATAPQALRVTVAPIGDDALDGWIWLLDDLSAETRARDQLAEQEQKFRHFYQGLQDAVVFSDLTGRLVEWNQAFQTLLGYDTAQLARMTTDDLAPADGREHGSAQVTGQLQAEGYSAPFEKALRHADGRTIVVEARTFLRCGADGTPIGTWEIARDITQRKHVEAQLILAATAFARSADGVVLTDATERILTINDTFASVTGYSLQELRGRTPRLLQSGRHPAAFYRAMQEALHTHGWWQGEIWNRRRNGDLFFQWLSIKAVTDDDGNLTHYIGIYRDAAAVQQSQQRIEYLATHDVLTGLPNRTLFEDRFALALARAGRTNRMLGLLFIDLDEFKNINDTSGHRAGDALLVEVAHRLTRVMRTEDTVARHGGDEFALLVEAGSVEELAAVCQRVLPALAEVHRINELQTSVPASIGISVYPADGDDPETLLRKADTALHRAKAQGKNTYRFFTEDMAEQVNQQLRIESGLRQALARGELFLQYQPQIAVRGEHLEGCEALLRWRSEGRTVSPALFIPVAEQTGLIISITEWVLTEVCRQIRHWDTQGLNIGMVSVNMSARHFQQDDVVARLLALVRAEGIEPRRLCLEITEGALMDPARSERLLHAFTQAGFQVSVDDFGTGFSSLSYLKRFPIDELKIDRSFVSCIESSASDRAIVAAILAMAHSLGMRVVAEGVETPRQLDYLRERGCDTIQGYLFSPPLSPEDLLTRYRQSESTAS